MRALRPLLALALLVSAALIPEAGAGAVDGAVQPDVLIQREPNGPWVGGDRYRPDGAGQTLVAPLLPGTGATFRLLIQNDGTAADSLVVQGGAGDPHITIRYFRGAQEVTGQVVAGTYRLADLPPGGQSSLRMTVLVGQGTPQGVEITRWVTATSETDAAVSDRVGVVVRRAPATVQLVDVGPALGLPRVTHSWDLVVGRVDPGPVPDLVFSDHSVASVYVNDQPGLRRVFRWDAPDPHGCALADVDGNGRGDVYCVQGAEGGTGHKNNRLFLQQDDGTWLDRTHAYGVEDQFGRGRRTTFIDLDHVGGVDLFVGNENQRSDEELSVNRTFLNDGSVPLADRRLGPIGNKGALCVQAVDQDGDGWQDLLLCGGAGAATPGHDPADDRLFLFRNLPAAGGGRRLVDVSRDLGIAVHDARSARLARLNGDGLLDLVVVGPTAVIVWPGRTGGGFGLPVFSHRLSAGVWVAIGDVDGRLGRDLFVVQACNAHGNARDLLLLDAPGWDYDEVQAPTVGRGCGDTAAMLDVDGDHRQDVVVTNGRWARRGPVQVLTAGPWRG